MIRLPHIYRSDDDEYAPIDYTFVSSQAEGQRRKEAEAIHQRSGDAVVRHRVDPFDRKVDAYGTHARRSPMDLPPPQPVKRGLPSLQDGPAPAQRIAFPQKQEPVWEESREAADDAMVQEGKEFQESSGEGPLFDAPVPPEIPEWLRIAKQNNMPLTDRPLRRPSVVAAPPLEEPPKDLLGRPLSGRRTDRSPGGDAGADYQEAGYPEELLRQQYAQEQALRAETGRRAHGAQYARRHQRQEGEMGRQDSRRRALAPQEQELWQTFAPQDAAATGQFSGGYVRDYAPRSAANVGPNAPPAYDPYWHQGYDVPGEDPLAALDPAPYSRRTRAARPQEERDQTYIQEEVRAGRSIPWLGIGTAAMAFLAVILWLMQMSFAGQKQEIIREREATAAAIRDSHPYRYRELIETQAQLNNLHPAFIAAIVLNESSFNPQAESSVGARGLMQMMPDTAQWVHGKIAKGEEYSFDSMYDPAVNVRYACWYMRFLSERFRGDPVLVAAAFHAGQGTVQNWLNDSRYSADSLTIELEDMMDGPTKNYASRVLDAYAVYKGLFYQDQGTL